jgi:hypothetical protein
MFSFITMNWRGRPLTTLRTIVELISASSTNAGPSVRAAYDPSGYPTGVKVTVICQRAVARRVVAP